MIKGAWQSPRVCADNVIRWYEGDTFKIDLNIGLEDTNGSTIPVEETDVFLMQVFKKDEMIHEVEVTGTSIIPFEMTEELTAQFPKGEYTYNVYLKGEYRTTLVRSNKLVVE